MKTFLSVISTLSAILLFLLTVISGGLPAAKDPVLSNGYEDTIMFVSDYQSTFKDVAMVDREASLSGILGAIENEAPGLVVGGGDYQSTFVGKVGTAFGVYSMRKAIDKKWNYGVQYLLCQGNHDEPKSVCINNSGLYKFANYSVYLINEDDFPWHQNTDEKALQTVTDTADKLDEALTSLVAENSHKPVFIVSHLPLHYTSRSSSGDNLYASILYDVISRNSDSLNIVYLFGHNHSGTYDDYIGGAVNYIGKGEKLMLGGSNEERTLNFTYTNCGYIGYSNNTDSGSSTSALTATIIKVSSNELSIKKYSKDGVVMEKAVGISSSAFLSDAA